MEVVAPAASRPTTRSAPTGPGRGGVPASPVRLAPGKRVPGTRYRIVRWIGEGGMGVVYEVEHMDIDRRAALKVLRARADDQPDLAEKFREEARAASTIGSEHIVEIFDFGALPDGRLMFTMELLDGHALVDEIEAHPLPLDRLLPILRQAAKGLGAAHRRGVIHRDVKPENLMLCRRPDGRGDWVKIVDFGLARFLRGETVAEQDLAGSPHYMAPELCLGLPYDGRVDQYALGCVAYELLCGEPPFMAPDIEGVLRAQVYDAPVPPSGRVGNACPAALEAVILRLLAKEPDARFEDFHGLEAALCEVQLELGIETPWDDLPLPDVDPDRRARLTALLPDPEHALVDHTMRRSRAFFAGSLLATAIVLAGGAYVALRPPPAAATSVVDELASAAKEAAARAAFVYPARSEPSAPTAYQIVRRMEQLEGRAAKAGAARAAELRRAFAETLLGLGNRYWELPEGRPFAAEFYTMALLFRPDDPTARKRAYVTPAQLARLAARAEAGDFTEGELGAVAFLEPLTIQPVEEAAEAVAEAMEADPAVPPSTRRLAQRFVEAQTGRRSRSADPPSPTRSSFDAPSADDDPPADDDPAADDGGDPPEAAPASKPDRRRAQSLVRRGRKHLARGALAEAEAAFHAALAADPGSVGALLGLSDTAFERGRYERAVVWARRAVRRAPRNGAAHIRLGDAYYRVLRYREAEKAYVRALALGVASARSRLEKIRAKIGP